MASDARRGGNRSVAHAVAHAREKAPNSRNPEMQKPRLSRGFLLEPKVGIEPTTY
jgi:hypothetical protein